MWGKVKAPLFQQRLKEAKKLKWHLKLKVLMDNPKVTEKGATAKQALHALKTWEGNVVAAKKALTGT